MTFVSRWYQVYVQRMNNGYFKHVTTRYKPFIDAIDKVKRPNDKFIEVGCGPGNITRALIERQYEQEERLDLYQHLCIDNDSDLLLLAELNLGQIPEFKKLDVRDSQGMKQYQGDIIHSHGLLEHYTDQEINLIIDIQKSMGARHLFHYVPGEKYEVPSFGDERLLSAKEWNNICKPTEVLLFNKGFDYILVWDL